jgi:hypothetical protein
VLSLIYSDLLDVRIAGIVQATDSATHNTLAALLQPDKHRIGFDTFQQFAAIIDLDGELSVLY